MTLKIRYRGTPAPVESFDSLLSAEGLRVDHKPVVEGSGGRDAIVWVMLYVADPAASGDIEADQGALVRPKVESAIAKFKLEHPHAQVEIIEASVAQPPGHH